MIGRLLGTEVGVNAVFEVSLDRVLYNIFRCSVLPISDCGLVLELSSS